MFEKLRSRMGRKGGNLSQFAAPFEVRESAGPIERSFGDHAGRETGKWQHYFPVYDRLLLRFKDRRVRLLEIGVAKGGSLELWRKYFGPDAVIFGIDIDPACAAFDGEAAQVRIGSQDDPSFLRSVAGEMGGVDIIIDDGSHVSRHMKTSFDVLFPLLSEGGLYIVEDTHACYWRAFEGAYRRRWTFIEYAKRIIDDMHRWYHPFENEFAAADDVLSVQFFDSMIVFEKARRPRPAKVSAPVLRS